jgi:hypothetical protein
MDVPALVETVRRMIRDLEKEAGGYPPSARGVAEREIERLRKMIEPDEGKHCPACGRRWKAKK